MKKYLETGKIVAEQGVKGEVRVQYWCDSAEFLCEFDELYLNKGRGEKEKITIEYARPHKNLVVMKIAGVDTVEDAQKYRNKILYIDRDSVELEEGNYFVQDLIGLVVIDNDSGEEYGKISNVTETGANDVYHIKSGEKILYIPAIPDVVKEVDIDGGVMKIHVLEGLFE